MTHRRCLPTLHLRLLLAALLLACCCGGALAARPDAAASAFEEPPASASAAAPFALPSRPARPSAGPLEHTPEVVPIEGDEDEAAATTATAPAALGRSAARSAARDSPSARSAAGPKPTGSAAAASAANSSSTHRPRRGPRRFRHSGIVAPSGLTVTPQEAAQQMQRQQAARRRRSRARRAEGDKRRAAEAAGADAEPGPVATAEPLASPSASAEPADSADADADAEAEADSDADTADDDSLPAANLTLPFDDPPTLQARADALTHAGFSVLHYDVTLAVAARNVDDDLNVLQLQCAKRVPTAAAPNATLALQMVVVDADAAMDEYVPGTVLHGSAMWGCGDGHAGTVMGRVDNATRIDDHTVRLLLSHAGYEQLFERAEIIFQQPKEEQDEEEEEDEETEGRPQPAAEAQPSDAPAATSSATPSARGSRRRRTMALPPSMGSMPFNLPEVIEAQAGAVESAAASPAAPAGRAFRHMSDADPHVRLILPSGMLTSRSTLTVLVKPYHTVNNGEWRVWLKRYLPLGSDTDLGKWETTKRCIGGQECTLSIWLGNWNGVDTSMWGYYLEVEYSQEPFCWPGFCVHNTKTEQFWLPVSSSGSLLGSGQGISAYSRTCDDLRDCDNSYVSKSALDSVMCLVCTPTRKVSIKMACDGCVIEYGATISKLYMVYNLEPWNLYFKTQLVADARVEARLAASAEVAMSFEAIKNFNVLKEKKIAIPYTGITIAGITLGMSASISLDLQAKLNFQGAATVNARTTLVANMQGSVGYDTRTTPQYTNTGTPPAVTFSEDPVVTINAAAHIGMELMLRPTIKLEVSYVAYANLSADAFLRVDGFFRYPPFPALEEPYQLPAPVPASLWNFGSCLSPHFLRYGVTAGVRNVALGAALELTIGSTLLGVHWVDFTHEFTPLILLEVWQKQIVSGCLLHTRDDEPGTDKTLQLRSSQQLDDMERSALVFNLELDVSTALGVDSKRVRVQLLDSYQRPLSHAAHTTLGLPSGDDHEASVSHGRAMRAQATATVSGAKITVVSSTEAGEPSAAAVTQSLNEQMALPSSALNRGVAASRFVPPVSYSWSSVAWGGCSCASRTQTGSTACSGSDGSTTTLGLCGSKPTLTQACVPSGCGTSGGGGSGGGGGGGGSGGGGGGSGGGNGGGGAGDGGIGDGGGDGGDYYNGGVGSDSDSSSGIPVVWIGVGVGGGVAVLAASALLAYFCYFKPRSAAYLAKEIVPVGADALSQATGVAAMAPSANCKPPLPDADLTQVTAFVQDEAGDEPGARPHAHAAPVAQVPAQQPEAARSQHWAVRVSAVPNINAPVAVGRPMHQPPQQQAYVNPPTWLPGGVPAHIAPVPVAMRPEHARYTYA